MFRGRQRLAASAVAIGFAFLVPRAAAQDPLLRDIYANVRLAGAWVVNKPNGNLAVEYDLKNFAGRRLVLPLTKIGQAANFWTGSRQLWIERVGGGPIPLPKNTEKRGQQYAFGGYAIPTAGTWEANQFQRFHDEFSIAGFPPGRYILTVEFRTLFHGKKDALLHAQTVQIVVP